MNKTFTTPSATKVIWIGAFANLFLSLVKIAGGLYGRSTALVTDGVHSLSDLLTDLIVLVTYKIGQQPPDKNHPYGHGRAETLGATLIGAVILIAGAGLAYEAGMTVTEGTERVPSLWAAIAAAISILTNEGLFHYTRAAGEKAQSPSLVANAWHHRSDAVSSIAALIGIGGAMMGFPLMDPLAAIVVAIMILKVGYEIVFSGISDLMDTALSEKETRRMEAQINNIPGVLRTHNLRSRRIGGDVLMDVHIQVDKDASVTEGHHIAEKVRRSLINQYREVQEVLVHVDTEDDTDLEPIYWTSREELQRQADPIISSTPGILTRTHLRTHYQKGKTILEVFVRPEPGLSLEEINSAVAALNKNLLNVDHVDVVRVFLDINKD